MKNLPPKQMVVLAGVSLALASGSAHAWQNSQGQNQNPVQRTILETCYLLPPINDRLIHNPHSGDQTDLKETGDKCQQRKRGQYQYNYAYRIKTKVAIDRLGPNGEMQTKMREVTHNKTERFRGDEIKYVKNFAKNFIESHKFQRCGK